ncbi:MAG: NAD kinase [Bergeyella sp.]|nr:NAD kinase [Bergeyella sp.]
MVVAVYTQKSDSGTQKYLERFFTLLNEKSVEILLFSGCENLMGTKKNCTTFSNKEDLKKHKVAYFFTFGGDGTLVNSLLFVQDTGIPVVGVNMGRLGFLASFTKEEILTKIDDLLTESPRICKRNVIEVISPGGLFFPYALNDITISRKETTSMISVESYIDGEFLNVFWGDGLIISSPTGSTAYSMSCGGPIISPSSKNFVITPIAPHNLNVRPLVLDNSVEIRLKIHSRVPQYTLSLDSRLIHLDTQVEIVLKNAGFDLSLVQPKSLSFFQTLRKKLLWGQDQRN